MNSIPGYLIDSDVLIDAKNQYYGFSICPGFWESIRHYYSLGYIYSIDQIKDELLRVKDDLAKWIRQPDLDQFFLASDDHQIIETYKKIIYWADDNIQYTNAAKAKFASSADGWLVAHGLVTGKIVVTREESRPNAQKAIKLPDVCNEFGVQWESPFSMLHRLSIKYHYSP